MMLVPKMGLDRKAQSSRSLLKPLPAPPYPSPSFASSSHIKKWQHSPNNICTKGKTRKGEKKKERKKHHEENKDDCNNRRNSHLLRKVPILFVVQTTTWYNLYPFPETKPRAQHP